MALISSSGFAHVRLTVTDVAASKAFYDRVFGWPAVIDNSARADQPGVRESQAEFYGGVVYQAPSGALFGLRPVAPAGQRFDSEHTGLDHVSFQVTARQELLTARDRLAEAGIPHGEVTDLSDASLAILSFSDPDGVHLELTAPLS
jgi:catechol 2,3-dioxygenase-like lactoylglutathione lyase family enzyme